MVEKKEKKVSKKGKKEEYLKDLQRVQAEFENFRKRVEEEKKEWIDAGKKEVLLELLGFYEGLEKAAEKAEDEGIKLLFEEFNGFLEKTSVKEIECLGKKFDMEKMHVMNTGNDKGKGNETVLEVFQKGFMFKEKVLRPALVQVNKL